MVIYLVLIGLLILFPSKLQLHGINDTYLSKESCNTVKGVFILLIFASHFANSYGRGYTNIFDTTYWEFRMALGQGVVAHFLFYSGYGVMLSTAKKGKNYIKEFPRKRILKTLLVYDCSQLIFLIFQLWAGNHYDIKQFVLSFLAWSSFGNDNWYVFVIIGLYSISWLVLKNERTDKVGAFKITVGTLAFTLFLICAKPGATYWYNTTLCYALGAWYFVYQSDIEKVLKKDIFYFLCVGAITALYLLAHKFWYKNLAVYMLTMLLFTLVIVFATMKFQIKNRFLAYCGNHLQGLFLLHRLPMRFLERYSFFTDNLYVFFASSVVMTFILEFGFNRLVICMEGAGKGDKNE